MKPPLGRAGPMSYQVGSYTVRRDATANIWRVFSGSVCVNHGPLLDMWAYAERQTARLTITPRTQP